jgi:cell division protein FtsN
MSNKKNPSDKGKKKYVFQLSFSTLLVSSITFLFILGWVFSLGIMVGRGFFPNTIDILSFIKGKSAKEEDKKKYNHVLPIKEEELSFYNQLIDKKDKARKKIPLSPAAPPPPPKKVDETKEVKIKEVETKKAKPVNNVEKYSVQVAALKDMDQTEKMVDRLTKLGYQAYYYKTVIKGEVFYRVRCGPYRGMEEAKKHAEKLADIKGFKPILVHLNID